MAIASTYGKNSLAAKYAAEATHGAVYTTAPTGGSAGTEPGAPYARKPLTWTAPANGVITASATFDIPGGTDVKGTGVHTALTAGDFVDGKMEATVNFPTPDTVTVNYTYTQS